MDKHEQKLDRMRPGKRWAFTGSKKSNTIGFIIGFLLIAAYIAYTGWGFVQNVKEQKAAGNAAPQVESSEPAPVNE